jgi:hypothetical protein
VDDCGERFREITAAYEALSDEKFKLWYDTEPEESQHHEGQEADSAYDFVRCQECGKITAQARHIVFWRVTSFVLASHKQPVQKIYCRPCAGKEQWKSVFWTGFVGWWGIPWGPIWSVGYGFANALGGRRNANIDEALMWQNAAAFASRGDGAIAVGLCNRLRKSDNTQIAGASADIIRFFKERGIDPSTNVKDVWSQSLERTALLLCAAFILPLTVILLLFIESANSSPSTSSNSEPVTVRVPAVDEVSGLQTTEAAPEAPPPVPTCATPPENGEVLVDRRPASEGHRLEIENGTAGDAIVKVRDGVTGKLLASFFVNRGATAQLENVPDGTYQIQYALGDKLAKNCHSFVNDGTASANKFPDLDQLQTRYEETPDGTRIIHQVLSYTLYSVPGGNVRPSDIDMTDFDKS